MMISSVTLVLALTTFCLMTGVQSINITDLRLSGGFGPFDGRVEVNVNGVWGTICDDRFDMKDAEVLCRMMGVTASWYFPGAWYGKGTGPVFASRLGCQGNEAHINECFFEPANLCEHSQDVSLFCTECGSITIVDGDIVSVYANSSGLSVACRYSNVTIQSTCQINSDWTLPVIICDRINITNIRLVDGVGLFDGRVELLVGDAWGGIYESNTLDTNVGKTICSMLGWTFVKFMEGKYFRSSDACYMKSVQCMPNIDHIGDCVYTRAIRCSKFVAIQCEEYPLNVTGIRLVDGPSPNIGRLELRHRTIWGTVCYGRTSSSSTINKYGAETFCKMLDGMSVTKYYLSEGTLPIIIGSLDCSEVNEHINQCNRYYQPSKKDCNTGNQLSLICTYCGSLDEPNGVIISGNDTVVTIKCNTGYAPEEYTAECLDDGTWLRNDSCEVDDYPLEITDINLFDGVGLYDGRVEVYVNSTWGTVCSFKFDDNDASALCKMITGLPVHRYTHGEYNGEDTGPILINNLNCNGSEKHINECKYFVKNSCKHSQDVAVVCDGMPLNITDIRLENGTVYTGRVEVYVDGIWGTVCNQTITVHVASTWCKMFNLSLKTFHEPKFQYTDDGPVLIGEMKCPVGSSHIDNCTKYPPGRFKPVCTHDHDLWLSCTENRSTITGVRVNGTAGPYHGRVEVEINNTWGTVCQHSFGKNDANVFCRMLGASTVRNVHSDAHFGKGEGPVHINLLDCAGTEKDINECLFIYDNTCDHNEDVSLECYGPPLNITETRLANGWEKYDGRAEIKVRDTWGTICDQGFGDHETNAFCNTLGLRGLHYISGNTYGEGEGPVYIDKLLCSSGHTDIRQCPYLYQRACTHSRDVGVICSGPPLNITHVRLANGFEKYDGRAEIKVWGSWGTICDQGFGVHEANLFCKMLGMRGLRYLRGAVYGEGEGPVHIDRLYCTPDHTDFRNCPYLYQRTCTHSNDISVVCSGLPLNITGVRLANGTSKYNGRAEIRVGDTWGTICDQDFDMNDLNAFCSMLGWKGLNYITNANYGEGKGPVFIDGLYCEPGSTSIRECPYLYLRQCSHSRDISVVCSECERSDLHFWNNGFFNIDGATLYADCSYYKTYLGTLGLVCDKATNTWKTTGRCKEYSYPLPITDTRLVGDNRASNGRVEFKVMNTWGTVCSDGFGQNEADVVCRMAGYISASQYYEIDTHTERRGPIFVDELKCGESVTHINECTYVTLDDCTHQDDVYVVCTDCRSLQPDNGRVNSSETTSGAVVSVTCNKGYKIIGSSVTRCQSGGKWSDSPICAIIDCGDPSPSNGILNTTSTNNGTVAAVSCNMGYILIGGNIIVCTEDGSWTGSPYCQLVECGDPTPVHGSIVGADSTSYGDVVEIVCDNMYEMVGDSKIVCTDGGAWSSQTTCKLIDCGPVSPIINGNVVYGENTYYGSKVVFYCNEGYLMIGKDSALCGDFSIWSNGPPICTEPFRHGETCQGDAYCRTDGAVCVDSVCTCPSGVYENTMDKCDAMPLFPYGEEQADSTIPISEECISISFSMKVPVFDTTYTSARICRDGFISLTATSLMKATVSVGDMKSNNKILAPFYTTTNRGFGNVHYRIYDAVHDTVFNEFHEEMDRIERYVVRFSEMEEFDVSFVLIVTWDDMKSDNDIQIDTSKSVRFQLVMVSDGLTTFVFYIYGSGRMQWKAVKPTSVEIDVWAGYHIPYMHNYNVPGSLTTSMLDMDSYVTDGVSGLVFLQSPHLVNKDIQCVKWFKQNAKMRYYNELSASLMPACPCEIRLAQWDPWFWRIQRGRYTKDYVCVDMGPGRHDPFGKSCCYDTRTQMWIGKRPLSGSFYRYNQGYKQQHYINDQSPKDWCCSGNGIHCDLYYKLRPTGTCYRQRQFGMGGIWGDPHYRTLDGKRFTFNGLGEYTLLQVRTHSIEFDLQARTERYINTNGTISDATIFTAFAAMDDVRNSIHVEINNAKTGLNIYANKIDLTNVFNSVNEDPDLDETVIYTSEDDNLILTAGGSLIVFFPTSGIALNISVNVSMLLLTTLIPTSLKNHTTGLLGNYNGDVFDEFILPNGTKLQDTMSEHEIFLYGQEWTIDPQHSAFVYQKGFSHTDYHNVTHVPPFLEDVDDVVRYKAGLVCGGVDNTECIFDLIFTENETIALETKAIADQFEHIVEEMMEEMPYLIGCETRHVTIQSEVVCDISIDDHDDVYFISNNVSAVYDSSSKTVKYFQMDDMPVDLRFAAVNENGRQSLSFVIDILMCTGCNDRGVCKDIPRQDSRATDHFQYATCECFSQYTGLDCAEEYDWCSEQPCSLGRNCTTLTVTEQTQMDKPYLCSSCPNGFMGNNDQECLDIDECDNVDTCDHNCINTYGSYICTCESGYKVDQRDPHLCKDIDECHDMDSPHTCSQQCQNTVGSFSCTCYNGYQINPSTFKCEPELSEDDSACKAKDCSGAEGCTYDDNGNAKCFCGHGYTLDSSGMMCIDKDECTENICPQDCENMIGSFQCVCYVGYSLASNANCIKCDDSHRGDNCTNICSCDNLGTEKCTPEKGCICHDGWYGNECDMNANECDAIGDICGDVRRGCVDTIGSYRCECILGYTESVDGQCQDINECENPKLNECGQICINTHGSYSCECYTGYTELANECINIDECEMNIHKCEQICEDHPGTYNCFCHIGYMLNDDRHTCMQVSDPCLSRNNLTCSHFCNVDVDDGVCGCRQGFTLGSDEITCIDTMECSDGKLNNCDKKASCKNTAQSYKCICPAGSKLNNDGRTCTDCDSSHYGLDCQQTCSCLHGICDNIIGCLCDTGWVGMDCDMDVDECFSGRITCTKKHTECINTMGSAVCKCKHGFEDIDGTCKDVNECADRYSNTCKQICTNQQGSYQCSCHAGFIYVNDSCKDIDECRGFHECEQLCEKNAGSYTCYCADGFHIDVDNRLSCIPHEPCSDSEVVECGHHASCYRLDGNPQCICQNGYNMMSGECTDIDECGDLFCSHSCDNSAGYFTCSCNIGYRLNEDNLSCSECDNWTFGNNCLSVCSCNVANSFSCDSTNGTCTCKHGWTGNTCNTDIDECIDEPACTNHSTCINYQGGYHCDCNTGYIETSVGTCQECDIRYYGTKCTNECKCMLYHTHSCDHVTGFCSCLEGWRGTECDKDVNDCNCSDKPHSKCDNQKDSYTCNCVSGYFEQDDRCLDINECLLDISVHGCTELCYNTDGGHVCECHDGSDTCKHTVYIVIGVVVGVAVIAAITILIIFIKYKKASLGQVQPQRNTICKKDIVDLK